MNVAEVYRESLYFASIKKVAIGRLAPSTHLELRVALNDTLKLETDLKSKEVDLKQREKVIKLHKHHMNDRIGVSVAQNMIVLDKHYHTEVDQNEIFVAGPNRVYKTLFLQKQHLDVDRPNQIEIIDYCYRTVIRFSTLVRSLNHVTELDRE